MESDRPFMYGAQELSELVLFLLKHGLTKPARDEVAAASAAYIKLAVANGDIALDPSLETGEQAALSALRKTGYAPIANIFSASELDEFQDYLADKPVTYEIGADKEAVTHETVIEEVPPNVSLAHYKAADLCRCPLVYGVIHNERLINLMGTYLGAPPSVSSVATWWSFPDRTQPDKNQPFHHDRDDFSIAKLFVYLTDVTPNTGPHAYLLRTHTTNYLREGLAHLAPEDTATFWAWMEKFMKPDNEVLGVFGPERLKIVTGKRGSSFLEDTRGLHRAVYPREGSRLAFEVTYTILPKYNEVHDRISRRDLPFPTREADLSPLVRYATRLLFR